jgi:outer membrane beta-barrel protein
MKRLSLFLLPLFILTVGFIHADAVAQSTSDSQASSAPKQTQQNKKETDEDIGNLRISGIDVVQNRVFIKGKRHEFTLGAGVILDNPFTRYQLGQFRYTYHFREMIGLELGYGYAISQDKALVSQLEGVQCAPGEFFDENGNDLSNVDGACGITLDPAPDPIKHAFNANFIWSPIYGKFSLFSKRIYHFDLFITAGVGYYMTERDEAYIGFNGGIGGKIYINEFMAFRADLRNLTIKEEAPFSNIVNDRILSVGLSFFAPTKINRERAR